MKRQEDVQEKSGLFIGSEPIDGMTDRRVSAKGDDDSTDRGDKGDDDSSDQGDDDSSGKGDGAADSRDADGKD